MDNRLGSCAQMNSFNSQTNSDSKVAAGLPSQMLSSASLKAFCINDLKTATGNFCPDSLVGEGGFGSVYKGWIGEQYMSPSRPGSGMVVAVKHFETKGLLGQKEWLADVNYLGALHHPNVAKLIGYCHDGEHRLLVEEFSSKGSLELQLFKRGAQPLSWATRIKVAIGAAKGLAFLHGEPQIVYRDFKSSNILLDDELNAKLSNFCLMKAHRFTGDCTEVLEIQSYASTAAPEYAATGCLSTKSDVYDYGVVLLELLTGRLRLDLSKDGAEKSLIDWTKPYLGDRRALFGIMDTKLEGQYPPKAAFAVAKLAKQCLHPKPSSRPTMSKVLEELHKLQELRNFEVGCQFCCF